MFKLGKYAGANLDRMKIAGPMNAVSIAARDCRPADPPRGGESLTNPSF